MAEHNGLKMPGEYTDLSYEDGEKSGSGTTRWVAADTCTVFKWIGFIAAGCGTGILLHRQWAGHWLWQNANNNPNGNNAVEQNVVNTDLNAHGDDGDSSEEFDLSEEQQNDWVGNPYENVNPLYVDSAKAYYVHMKEYVQRYYGGDTSVVETLKLDMKVLRGWGVNEQFVESICPQIYRMINESDSDSDSD